MKRILFIGAFFPPNLEKCFEGEEVSLCHTPSAIQAIARLKEEGSTVCLALFYLTHESTDAFMQLRYFMLKNPKLAIIPFVVISAHPSSRLKKLSRKFRAHDFIIPLNTSSAVCNRLRSLASRNAGQKPAGTFFLPAFDKSAAKNNFPIWNPRLDQFWKLVKSKPGNYFSLSPKEWRLPLWKRICDLAGALLLLILLAPVFILISLLIKLESKGPVLYISKRAGQGYKIFDFYKFRSMRAEADQRLGHLHAQNEYRRPVKPTVAPPGLQPQGQLLVQDSGYIEEGIFRQKRLEQKAGTFIKIRNDPRVTRVGRFIRATSIDELPQLFNVIKGDMSLVGNRPIPLYEAEQLTSDQNIARFFAPAGITGLWQITKTSNNNISEEDRKLLDIEYAKSFDFWMDLRILLKTLPAVFQHDNS